MIHAYKEINEVVGLNGWIVISCCFNHDVHPCEDVFLMSSPWIIVYIKLYIIYIYMYTYIYIYVYIYVCVCACVIVCVYYVYIYIYTYAHQKPYIRTYINMAIAHKTQPFQDQTFHANSSRVSPWQLQPLLTERHHQLPSVGPLENWCVWSTLRHSKGPKRVDSSKVHFQNRGNYHVSILLIPFGGCYHLKKMMI